MSVRFSVASMLLVALPLSGCGLLGQKAVEQGNAAYSPSHAVTLLAEALALNYIYQPFEPNWDVADVAMSHDTHRVSLRMKRFVTGGEGEAWMIAKRYAERLVVAKGASGYAFLDFTQGIDSGTPIARRTAEGTIRFFNVPPAPVANVKPAGTLGAPRS